MSGKNHKGVLKKEKKEAGVIHFCKTCNFGIWKNKPT